MKNKSMGCFKSTLFLSAFLVLTTNLVQASTDSLFVVSGNQGGIGIGFNVDSVDARITQIFPNTPAERSGRLNIGDRIIGVGQGEDGEMIDIQGKSSQEVIDLIAGQVDTKVRLAILSADKNASDPPIIVELVREQIQHRRINLSDISTWHFKSGDNMAWADPNFDHSEWLKMSQVDIREPLPDSLWNQGYGWFRTYFKADSTFYYNPWYLELYTLGAAEVYFDGKLVNRYGVFSTDLDLEKRYNPLNKSFSAIWLAPKDTHLVAVRFSYHEMQRDKEIMAKRPGLFGFILAFHSQKAHDLKNEYISHSKQLNVVIISVLSVLIILFWLIVFFNRSQVHMIYLATTTTLFLLPSLLPYLASIASYTSNLTFFLGILGFPSITAFLASFIFLLANLLQVRVHRLIKVYMTVVIIMAFGVYFFPDMQNYVAFSSIIPVAVICLYYLVRFRKKLIGPKAIIVYGLLLTFGLGIFVSMVPILEGYFVPFAIPFSLLVYLAFWLKEMIKNIQDKAEEVVRVSNEKKGLIENQNILLEEQVQARTEELNTSLENLKATQSQLIHSEKMASLGELTAGIAHEIQNPLNFVNNFSEVSSELIDDLNKELAEGEIDEVKAISSDLKENISKINHHGKRASDIVKSMLEHSKTSSGVKEPTDINALCDEYLRLAYHGLRAKDKFFNSKFETDFDTSIGKINVVPQDLGRVILNLITNAFYVVNQRASLKEEGYQPHVVVSTKRVDGKVIIAVKDNGKGIPENIKEKIFQPFFTTKPTGKGTGLGLSLSYDIIKAHGGKLNVSSELEKSTSFIIELPFKN